MPFSGGHPRFPRCYGVAFTVALFFAVSVPGLRADLTVYSSREVVWKYFPGLEEASAPDPAAWREPDFDDSSWPSAPAPFGYGDPPFVTDMNALDPPMQRNYTTLFLRRRFTVPDLSKVAVLQVRADFDDGFIVWVNGAEVLSVNAPDPPAFDGQATRSKESGEYELFNELPDPTTFLVEGENVLAVQAFNRSLSSTDFKVDVELFDPFGPDVTPPSVAVVVPAPGFPVRSLERIEVTFDEAVTGVDATDLLVGGRAAEAVEGSAEGPYVFQFAPAPAGETEVRWSSDHGITDVSEGQNAFPGGSWIYVVDPDAPEADLVISEFVASNDGALLDEDREPSDWIEVFNRGALPVDLSGFSLSDDPDDPSRWVFPSMVLDPQERVLVFASGKDRRDPAGELHASFKLNDSGEFLALYSADSPRRVLTEFAARYPEQRPGFSYGVGETGDAAYFDPPTPGEPNAPAVAFEGLVREPLFSVTRGFHEEPFTLEIVGSSPEEGVYYTLDGRDPTPETGILYEGPIDVAPPASRGLVSVRAAAYRDGFLPSEIVTHSYVFPDSVLAQSQSQPDFPARWGTQPADYQVDPRVVQRDVDRARRGLLSIPALSIVTDPANLFDLRTGIYANPSRSGLAWERPVSAEWIFPDGSRGFQIDAGLRIQGGSSTNSWKSIKVSMRLLFRGDYGAKKLEFPIFPDTRVERFDSIVLDAHLNLAYTHPDHGQRVRSQFVRDIFVADLQNAAGSLAPHGRFAHLYLNGLYWGMYDIHERPDNSFAAEYLGGEKEEYDILRHSGGQVVDGNGRAWLEMMQLVRSNLADNQQYLALGDRFLDIPDLIDYMTVNFYVGNDDWPRHNWYAGRRRLDGAKWRFFSWDAEHVLKDVTINRTGVSNSNSPAEIYAMLRRNTEFRVLFGDRVHRLFSSGGPMYVDPERPAWNEESPHLNVPASLYMERIREIDTAVVLESARWGDARRPNQPYTRENEFQRELDWLLGSYFPRRSTVVLSQLRAAGLYPRVEAPVFNRHGGQVPPGFQLVLSLPEGADGEIYYTTDGTDPRVFGTGELSPSSLIYSGPVALEDFANVKARTLSGGDWSALTEASFTVIEPRDALRITEIMYHSPSGPEGDFIELGNLSSVTVDLSGLWFSDGIFHVFPSGTSLGPGERLVLAADAQAFSALYPDVEIGGVYALDLANGGERVTLSDASGEVVVSVEYDDADFWPLGADGYGWSLVLADPDGDGVSPGSFRESGEPGGSPGAEDPPAGPRGVLVNEVLANSTAPLEDAVELHNPGTAAVDIGGWYLSDSRLDPASLRKYRIPEGTVVAAGGYAVFYEADFNPSPGSPESFALGSDGDDIYLSSADAAGELAGYIVGADFGASRDGVSLGRAGTSVGFDFTALDARTFGVDSPRRLEEFRGGTGAANSEPLVGRVVINEVHYHPAVGVEFVELHNRGDLAVTLSSNESGRGWRLDGLRNALGTDAWEFPEGARIAAGGYLVVAPVSEATFRALRAVPAETPVVGPYGGALANGGEHLRLEEPFLVNGEVAYARVDHVRFDDGGPWPEAPDGGGPSLERVSASEYGNEPLNWAASEVGGGTPGAPNTVSEPVEPTHGQLPGDSNQDGRLDLSDAVALLEQLFTGRPPPCEGDLAGPGANRTLLDADADNRVNLTDAVHLLRSLFQGGPPHALGTECIAIDGCPTVCRP